MPMLCKTGTICFRVADPHFIFDCICVCTIRTHMHRLLPEDLALSLNKVLSICTIHLFPTILSRVTCRSIPHLIASLIRPNNGLSSSTVSSSESIIILLRPSERRIMNLSEVLSIISSKTLLCKSSWVSIVLVMHWYAN